jgi:hypothetical protein
MVMVLQLAQYGGAVVASSLQFTLSLCNQSKRYCQQIGAAQGLLASTLKKSWPAEPALVGRLAQGLNVLSKVLSQRNISRG